MGKHAAAHFNQELKRLFDQRTHWLQHAVNSTKRKRPPKFNRSKVNKSIAKLQVLASDCVADSLAKKALNSLVVKKKQWHVKGRGCEKKKQYFDAFFVKQIPEKNYIYIFWKNRKCLYIGKTEKGKGRPQNHFSKYWFTQATRVDIHAVKSASQVLKLECLAKHRFNPA